MMLRKFPLYAGMIIPVWLFVGVTIAGFMNPGYSHINQAMSELGAEGSPTHVLSPNINNFPLGILFIVFGSYLISSFKQSKLAMVSGLMVLIHGIGSILAGYFSCDAGCQLLHLLARKSYTIFQASLCFFRSPLLVGYGYI